MGSQFYVTLPSNSSIRYFPENKTCRYTTKLHRPLALSEDFEVGLAEIQFQSTWYNVQESENYIDFIIRPERQVGSAPLVERVNVPTGYYASAAELCDSINATVSPELRQKVGFYYKKRSRKCFVELEEGIEVSIACPLARLMGFHGECLLRESTESPLPMDVHMLFHTFYLYSDIVQSQPVGDVAVPLLRTIAVAPSKRHENVVKNYVAPHYVPLKIHHFETIDIILTDETGEVIPFERGRLIVKLHFRERPSSLP